jgi:hypothetical protein
MRVISRGLTNSISRIIHHTWFDQDMYDNEMPPMMGTHG